MRRLVALTAAATAAPLLVLGATPAQATNCSAPPTISDGAYIAIYVDEEVDIPYTYFDPGGYGRFERDDYACDQGNDGNYSEFLIF